MSDEDGPLVTLAKAKRAEAVRARRLAETASLDVVESLKAYAARLEGDAFALEQRAAELAWTVGRSKELAQNVRELADEAARQLAVLKATLKKT